jgi:Zn-dependent metalloprotease
MSPDGVEVWVPAADGRGPDVLAQRSRHVESDDEVVRTAYEHGVEVLRYARSEFGRDGLDGRGSALRIRAHAPLGTDAQWYDDEQRIWLGDGDGRLMAPLGGAADVVAHEFFHGVIDHEVELGYTGQQGALHESFADVLATGIDGNWQIAEDVYTPGVDGDALRDLSRLTYTDVRRFPAGYDDVHVMSEAPSHAAYLVGRDLGMREMRRIWYIALTDHLRDRADFGGARTATIAAANALHGRGSTQGAAVAAAWDAVGVLRR